MYIKQFRSVPVRVADPLRPGRRTIEERLVPSVCTGLSHEGVEYTADADGWIEVPMEVGEVLTHRRHPGGERFYQPHEVDEQVRVGALDASEARQESGAKRGRPRSGASA